MSLTTQEARCVEAACRFLDGSRGGTWEPRTGPTLDEQYPNESSPEIVVTNGSTTAAIEVKRLTGDGEWNDYRKYFASLQRSLAPTSGGHWTLELPDEFHLPMEESTRRLVQRQIEQLSVSMRTGDEGEVKVPRHALMSRTSEAGRSSIICLHTGSNLPLFAEAEERISGQFMLVDTDGLEHSFVTEEAKAAFVEELVRACEQREREEQVTASWEEEWKLCRRGDGDGRVDPIIVTAAREIWKANVEAVDLVLDSALKKFRSRRWTDYHIVVLDRVGIMLEPQYLVQGVAQYDDETLSVVDIVLIVDDQSAVEAWRRVQD